MLVAVVEHFLDRVTERGFDAPFIALLLKLGFTEIHYLHGQYEFGKDFIGQLAEPAQRFQFVFQSKAGDLNLGDWSKGVPQLELLRANTLAHPGFNPVLPRRAVLLLTGRLVGGAPLAAQNYCDQALTSGVPLEVWDRESLIQRITTALEIGVAGRTEGPLFSLIGSIDDGSVNDIAIERFSRRWMSIDVDPWACTLEAAIVAERLAGTDRLDTACDTALGLVRAAWARHHGELPPHSTSLTLSEVGRLMFRTYAAALWERGSQSLPDPIEFIRQHDEPSGYITYPVRCMRYVELLSLLDLLPEIAGMESVSDRADIPKHIGHVISEHPGCGHPISDRWAVSIIPAALVLQRTGQQELLSTYLISLTKWIADRYDGEHVGLGSPVGEPLEETEYLLGRGFPVGQRRGRRSESYVSTIILDLAALSRLSDVYRVARNEFLAVRALACVLESRDDASQYRADDSSLSFEPNVPYSDECTDDLFAVAPTYARQLPERYLQRIDRSWDHLAVSAFLRDRHFLSAVQSFRST